MTESAKGYLYGAVAAACYGLNPLFAVPMYEAGVSVDSVLFYRYGLALAAIAAIMWRRGTGFAVARSEMLPLFVFGILLSLSSLALFESYNFLDVGIASTLLFVYPVMVAVIMAVMFRERPTVATVTAIALASAGIVLLYEGEGGVRLDAWGVALVFMSALFYAVYIVGVNHSVLKSMDTLRLTFYVLLFGMSLFIVRLRFGADLQPLGTPQLWADAVSLALFPTIVSFAFMTLSIHLIGSTPAAILGALEPVTALVCGVAVFGERLTPRVCLGVAAILAAVTLVILGRRLPGPRVAVAAVRRLGGAAGAIFGRRHS